MLLHARGDGAVNSISPSTFHAQGVISAIKHSGGRFLNKDKQGFYHLQSDEEVSKSVSNVIRGGAPGIRKEIYAFEKRTGVPPQTKEYDEGCYFEYSVYTLAGIRGNHMDKAMLSPGARELLKLSVLEEVIECDEVDIALLLAGKLGQDELLKFDHYNHPTLQRQSTDVTEVAGNKGPPPRQVSIESTPNSRQSSRRNSLRASMTSTASDEDKDTFETSNMDLFTRFTQRGSHRSLRTGLTDSSSDDELSTFSRITRRESQRSIMTGLTGLSDLSPQDDMSLVSRPLTSPLTKLGSIRSLQTGSCSTLTGRSGSSSINRRIGEDLDFQMDLSDTSRLSSHGGGKYVSRRLQKRGSIRSIRTGVSSLGRSVDLSLQMEDMNLHPRHFAAVMGSNRSIGSGFSGISMYSQSSIASSISAIDASERSI